MGGQGGYPRPRRRILAKAMEDGVAEPELEEHLRQVLVRGLQPVRVSWSSPTRPGQPATSATSPLREVLGGRLRLLSTSDLPRPGLVAKPVIDIVAGLDDPDDEPATCPIWRRRLGPPGPRTTPPLSCAAATLNCRPTCIATDPTTPRSTATFVSGAASLR